MLLCPSHFISTCDPVIRVHVLQGSPFCESMAMATVSEGEATLVFVPTNVEIDSFVWTDAW